MYKVYLIRRLKVRKKKSEILNIIKEEIISNYKSYILVIILFSVGLFLGVLFINQTENQENVIKYINTYICYKYKYINTKITFNVRKNRLVGNSNKLNNVKINAVRVLIL